MCNLNSTVALFVMSTFVFQSSFKNIHKNM